MKRFVEKLMNWPQARPAEKRVVHVTESGFTVTLGVEQKTRVDWKSVVEIAAFKHDLFSYDEICLGFRCEGDETFSWAGEEDDGFDALLKEVEQRFAGLRPGWFGEIAVPAFQENWTTIWRLDVTQNPRS